MVVFGASDVGMIRKDNQDSYMFDTVNADIGFAVVCDGMGGASGGKTASSVAVNSFSSNLISVSENFNKDEVYSLLYNAVRNANVDVYNLSITNEELSGMGTTLVSSLIINDRAYFVNVGDSRAYLIRDGILRRITKDHSAVQDLVDQGLLTENQARNHPNKNIITRALGVSGSIECDIFDEDLMKDDVILLCTDGVTNYIDDLEIPFEILRLQNIESVPQKLIELANSRGGADNSTVVVIKV